jgi:hypothetical protein
MISDEEQPSQDLFDRCNMKYVAKDGKVYVHGARRTLIDIAYVAAPRSVSTQSGAPGAFVHRFHGPSASKNRACRLRKSTFGVFAAVLP